MTLSQLSPIEQAEIIEIFGGLPPKECLSLDLTDAQIKRWYEIKTNWTVFKTALSNYFSGEYIFQDLVIEKRDEEFFELVLQRYLTLYDLLIWGWLDIQAFYEGIELPANKPGQAFAYILKGKATSEFLDERRSSTRTIYEGYKFLKHCEAKEIENQLTEEDKNKLQILAQRIKKKNPSPYPEYLHFLNSCVEACGKSRSKRIRQKCKNFKKIDAEWRDALLSYLHPRKAGRYKT